MSSPTENNFHEVKRVYRYLNGAVDFKLKFSGQTVTQTAKVLANKIMSLCHILKLNSLRWLKHVKKLFSGNCNMNVYYGSKHAIAATTVIIRK